MRKYDSISKDRPIDLFQDKELARKLISLESFKVRFLRLIAIYVVIPLWTFVGILTAGWLWPPQIREYLFQVPRKVKEDKQ